MPSVDTRVQLQSRGTVGQGGGPVGPAGNAPYSKWPQAQEHTHHAAFVAKRKPLIRECAFMLPRDARRYVLIDNDKISH